jgi:hypothetical protein
MLIDMKTYIDEEYGMVGLALKVKCQTFGGEMWLWSPPLTEYRVQPAVTAYQIESVAVPMPQWELMRTLCRLQAAGVLTAQERLGIHCLLMGEADRVQQYWDAKRQPVPTAYEIEMAKRKQEEDRPW